MVTTHQLRGAAALSEMLSLVGREGTTDHDVAKVLTDYELDLRLLLSATIRQLREELT